MRSVRHDTRFRRLRFEELEDRKLLANLTILSVSTNPAVPIAGEPFSVKVNFRHENATGAPYTIGRSINNRPEHTAPEIAWGNGGNWNHVWCCWILHSAGTYDITARIDSGDAIEETNENDNSLTQSITVGGTVTKEWALVKADEGRNLLGDGTNVIVGTMDDAFDFKHPWFSGNDSLGRPRLVAALQNNDGPEGSPVNAEHATRVMGVVLSRGDNAGDLTGLAPDARYVTAEFINRAQIPGHAVNHVLDAAGFLVENGAEVINMSWSWWSGTTDQSERGETSTTNLLADYLAYDRDIVPVPAVNQLPNHDRPTAPGSSRNAITVGGLDASLERAWDQQDYGPTLDGRSKPDLLGNNAAEGIAMLNWNWRNGPFIVMGVGGTSTATPHVTGAVAQMLDFGKRTGQSTDHRVIKSIIMNSGVKTLDDDGSAWSNTVSQPLDNQQGTGILNLVRVHEMYSAGRQSAGVVESRGYDFATIEGVAVEADRNSGGRQIYQLGTLPSNGTFDVTLAWDRHTFWDDRNDNKRIDSADSFFVSPVDAQDNLDLILYRDGVAVARSESQVDNVEHIHATDLASGVYELHVVRRDVSNSGIGEDYAVSWHLDVPKLPGYSVSASGGNTVVSESGTTDTFTVVLDSQPLTDVVITVTSGDPGEATVDKASLTFSASDWDTPQTVTVTGVDDATADGDQPTTITLSINDANSDDAFDPLADQTINVITTDDDTPSLMVNIAADSISENGGTTTATVTRNTNTISNLTVLLASNDPAEATVPATVIIPTGQVTSAPFTINAVDDATVDGTQTIIVTGTAAGHAGGSDTLNITDDDAATLTVTIVAGSISENAGATTATVTRNTNTTSALTITLTSDDTTEATVPATVSIPAGQLTSAPFIINAVDDAISDGMQTVTITATAVGHADGSDTLKVTDDDAPSLTITIVADSISENSGATSATVTRNSSTGSALAVTLTSNDVSEATAPATVTIPAGQVTSAPFAIAAVDDDLLDGTQTVTVTTSATGYVSDSDLLDVLDHETLTISINPTSIEENAGGAAATATVTRSNRDIADALTVMLASDDATEVTLPATVTIAAGNSSVQVPLDAVDDALRDETQTVSVSVMADGYVSGSGAVMVRHVNHAPLLSASSPQLGMASETETVDVAIETFVAGIDELDLGDSVGGIAVVSANGPGIWYSSIGGQAFVEMAEVGEDSALLLPPAARVRFVPAGQLGGVASLTYRAWDATVGIPGDRGDARDNGGISPFSLGIDTASLTVTNQNDAPTSITLSSLDVDEGKPGAVIGNVTVTDRDINDVHTFTISDDRFEVVNAQLKLKPLEALDHESNTTIAIAVTAADNGSPPLALTESFVIRVIDVNEFAPTLENAALSVDENATNGTLVGVLQATDADTRQTTRFELLESSAFSIDPASGEIRVEDSTQLDHEASEQIVLSVKVTDSGMPPKSTTTDVVIAVNDINEFAPMIDERSLRIVENEHTGTSVGFVLGTDQDRRQQLLYRITGASIADAFTIVADTGELVVNDETIFDYEVRTEVSLIVEVRDSGSPPRSSTAVVTVEIEDVNELSPAIQDQSFSVDEQTPAGFSVGVVSVRDQDRAQTLRFVILAGNANSAFAINSATGEITANTAHLDHETTPVHQLQVEVTDDIAPTRSNSATITISVRDVNEFTPEVPDQGFAIAEDSSNGLIVGSVFASDADTSQVLSYAITSGNADGAFAIDESTGNLTIADTSQLDHELSPERLLRVLVTDSGSPSRSTTGMIFISVLDVNEAPQVDARLVEQMIGANVLFGFELPDNAFVDPDAGDSLHYTAQLADGSPLPNWLSFDASRLQFSGAATDADAGVLEIRVTASDRGSPSLLETQSFPLTITTNPFPWHNASEPRDVDRDGRIAPVDALIVINELNSPKIPRSSGRLPLPYNPAEYPFDVNSDGSITPVDALIVINHLNRPVSTFAEAEFVRVLESEQGWESELEIHRRNTALADVLQPVAIAPHGFGVISKDSMTSPTPAQNRSVLEREFDDSLLEALAFDVAAAYADGLLRPLQESGESQLPCI